jgi:hypothetical protein
MRRHYVYRRPWSRAIRKLVRVGRFITTGISEPGLGDGIAFFRPSVNAFLAAGPAVVTNAVLGAAVGATPHAGSAADSDTKILPSTESDTYFGPSGDEE